MRTAALLLLVVACAPGEPAATPAPSAATSSAAPTATTTTRPPVTPTTPTVRPTVSPTVSPTASACAFPGAAPAAVVSRGPATRRVVALTFDAGSDAGSTATILDTLAAAGIPAGFGVTGDFARRNPALVARMRREGHQIVNHSDTHRSFTGVSSDRVVRTREARCADLRRAESAIAAAAPGPEVRRWFRPPYGDRDASVDRDVAAAGYRYVVMWTVDSRGWRGVPAAEVVRTTLAAAAPGAILLFHVGAASTDAAALPQVLAGLRARSYGFVTLTGLMA
ncbi:MAG TPA: polysaccharide deacetylase family protein [Frankiaceae bacterium]|nr:polysaccharide deacetylase family protein [Frankiaceae bacterium]